jgi:hypothetical protein
MSHLAALTLGVSMGKGTQTMRASLGLMNPRLSGEGALRALRGINRREVESLTRARLRPPTYIFNEKNIPELLHKSPQHMSQ